MAGSAFERVWKKRGDGEVATKKEARLWFARGMRELQRIQDMYANKHRELGEWGKNTPRKDIV